MKQFKNALSLIITNLILVILISYSLSFTIKSIVIDETNASRIFNQLWIFDYKNYIYAMALLITLLMCLILSSSIRQAKNSIRSFFRFNTQRILVSISIFVSIITIGVAYPAVPSISNYKQKAEALLNSGIKDTAEKVENAIRIGDYRYLNDTFIKSQYTLGYMHFRVIPGDNIKNNLSLLDIGDYAPIIPSDTIVSNTSFGVGGDPPRPSLHDNFFLKEPARSLSNSWSVFWEYKDTNFIQKANNVGFSAEITGSPNNCYTFYYQFQSALYSHSILKNNICLHDANPHQITMNINALEHQGSAEELKFTIEPDANNTKDKWIVSDAKIFLDKSGRGKVSSLDYCIEGVHDGAKDKTIHIQDGVITAGPCLIS